MLHLHRSERADALIAPLAAVLTEPPEDAFAADVVAVPTRGVERWVAQRLSHHLGAGDGEAGICANVTFGSPARLVADVVTAAAGVDPDEDPWRTERLTWPLLEVIDASAGEPWCAVLDRHLGAGEDDEVRHGRRLALARHLARLFGSYAAQRPDMTGAWARGLDDDDDGAGAAVPPDLAWQPELWRRLRERIGMPSPGEYLPDALLALTERPASVDLPARLSVFGPTRLPEDQLRVLRALAVHRDVHLWLPHPSPALWDRVAAAPRPASPRRRDQVTHAHHPLLASMARDATELQLRLTAEPGGAVVEHHPASAPTRTLLGALQERLRADDPRPGPHRLAADDRSVQVHACHGRARQVEVLREVLAGLFADDHTLEPRDVVVMSPDIEAIAPLVTATFGLAVDEPDAGPAAEPHPGQLLRVRLADRSPGHTNPLLTLLAALLALADGRVTVSEVLDLAASEAVRRRFRFSDDDLARVRDWSVETGVHWGEDGARRARFGLPDLRQGTWEVALDRVLLGAAMAEEDHRFVGHALPLDDVDSTDVDLAGRLAELLDRLADVLRTLAGPHPLGTWLDHLDRALTLLADPAEDWQGVQARWVLGDVRDSAHPTGEDYEGADLRLPDVRALLDDRLAGRPTRAGFRTGALTMCSMEPMRAVPHRVVCLLGVDDGTFPRGTSADGDDVLLRDPCVGERDRRSEDRQIFLDAVAAAGEHLVVLYSGADERTGAARPPAVPVGELLDAVDQAAAAPEGRPVREHVLVRHPLQVVDERNFLPGVLGRPGPLSFDTVAHAAALAGRGERSGGGPFLTAPLPPEPSAGGFRASNGDDGAQSPVVDLADLVAMLEHPVKWFLRRRLQISLAGETEDVEDRLPLELDPLEAWQIGDRLLTARLDGADPNQAFNAEWRRGEVPPKELGRAVLLDVGGRVEPVAVAAGRYTTGEARAVDLTLALPSGSVLAGTVPGVHGRSVVRATYSKLAPKHRLRAWVQALALAAAQGGQWRAVTVGRPPGTRPGALIATVTAPAQAQALARLDELVHLRALAAREPLPMPVPVSCAYGTSRFAGDSEVQALESAGREWAAAARFPDEHHDLCWGAGASLADILGEPTEEERPWWPEDRSRLGVLARRVWEPLLAHEETEPA